MTLSRVTSLLMVLSIVSCGTDSHQDGSNVSAEKTKSVKASVSGINSKGSYDDYKISIQDCEGMVCNVAMKQVHDNTIEISSVTLWFEDGSKEEVRDLNGKYDQNETNNVDFSKKPRPPIEKITFNAKKINVFGGGGKVEAVVKYVPFSAEEIEQEKNFEKGVKSVEKLIGDDLLRLAVLKIALSDSKNSEEINNARWAELEICQAMTQQALELSQARVDQKSSWFAEAMKQKLESRVLNRMKNSKVAATYKGLIEKNDQDFGKKYLEVSAMLINAKKKENAPSKAEIATKIQTLLADKSSEAYKEILASLGSMLELLP